MSRGTDGINLRCRCACQRAWVALPSSGHSDAQPAVYAGDDSHVKCHGNLDCIFVEEKIIWPAGSEDKTTPPPTPEVMEVLGDPWCYRIYTLLIGLGPIKPRDLAEAASKASSDTSVFSVVQHLRQLRAIGFAMSSEDAKQDRAKWWKVVPGGLVLTGILDAGEQEEAIDQWLDVYLLSQQTLMRRWRRRRRRDHPDWTRHATTYEVVTKLSLEQFVEMTDEVHDVMEKWRKIGRDQQQGDGVRAIYAGANIIPVTLDPKG